MDSAVAFLVLVVVGLIVGAGIVDLAILAVVMGAIAAPFTRRAEVRALTARATREQPAGEQPAP